MKTIVINFDDKSAELLENLKQSIADVLYEYGCDVDSFDDHDEAVLMEVSVPNLVSTEN